MPAIITNASKFLVDTDYPLDKIIYMYSNSVTVPATDVVDISIPHGLTFTPLMDGTYSTSPSFSTAFDIGGGEPYPGSFGFFAYSTSIDANATNVNFHVINFTSSSVTIYYRLFGLMPSNVNAIANNTASLADDFVINTDYNYTKLFSAQRFTSSNTITHNVGYRVQVSLWQEIISSGGIYKTIYADINNPGTPLLARINNNNVEVTINSALYAAHIRVYLDE